MYTSRFVSCLSSRVRNTFRQRVRTNIPSTFYNLRTESVLCDRSLKPVADVTKFAAHPTSICPSFPTTAIQLKTDDYVPGGKWLDAPGSPFRSGIYALAMAMATDPEVNDAPRWSAGTLEKRYYDALWDLRIDHFGFGGNDNFLNDGDLVDIMLAWDKRYKDSYQLYIEDDDDDIKPAQPGRESSKDAKVILVRFYWGRWQACCYFGEEDSSADTLHVDSSTNQHSSTNSSAITLCHQTSSGVSSTTPDQLDKPVNGVNNNSSTAVDLTSERLLSTLERLVSSVETLTLAVETRKTSEDSLHVAIHSLMASLDKVAQSQTQRLLEETTGKNGSKTSTEYYLGLNTPSTVQEIGTAESVSRLVDCDDAQDSSSHSDVMDYDDDLDNYDVNDLDKRTGQRKESLTSW